MIGSLANYIATIFVKKGWGSSEKHEIYRYGCEVIFSALMSISIVFICGFIFHKIWQSILFYVIFLLLRRYCGGYHADTYLICNIVFTIIMVISLLGITFYKHFSPIILSGISILTFIIVFQYSPIVHKNKKLRGEEVVLYRKVSLLLSALALGTVIIMTMVNMEIATIITFAMLSTSCTMIVSVMNGRRC